MRMEGGRAQEGGRRGARLEVCGCEGISQHKHRRHLGKDRIEGEGYAVRVRYSQERGHAGEGLCESGDDASEHSAHLRTHGREQKRGCRGKLRAVGCGRQDGASDARKRDDGGRGDRAWTARHWLSSSKWKGYRWENSAGVKVYVCSVGCEGKSSLGLVTRREASKCGVRQSGRGWAVQRTGLSARAMDVWCGYSTRKTSWSHLRVPNRQRKRCQA